MEPSVRALIRRDTYRDSVQLMRVAAEAERLPGVLHAALVMGTPANRDLLAATGLLHGNAADAGPTDLVIALAASDDATAEAALARVQERLAAGPGAATAAGTPTAPRTLADALALLPTANLALISTPGAYAAAEALKALKRGLHVFLFSDNVPLDEEIELKRVARRRGLLVMGPDCGTAILDGVPLGFANAVRRGRVGLIGASGTGLQQVSCLLDRLGEGVSQAIGVGGRDLDLRVGGLMMLASIERLAADPGTAVIGLVSKPPAPSVARHVLEAARGSGKPTVACFLGGDPSVVRDRGATPAATLDEAAALCAAHARGDDPDRAVRLAWTPDLVARADELAGRFAPGQRRIRGLYSGGTLCQEAALVLRELPGEHALVDLGADEFTLGRPHPMIDFRLRNEKILAAAKEPATAVILLDVVLGHAAHPDPAGALLPAIQEARAQAAAAGRHPVFVASVCGTPADPQPLAEQEGTLSAAGVLLAPSNALAARLAARLAVAAEAR
jgi:FdrA protein